MQVGSCAGACTGLDEASIVREGPGLEAMVYGAGLRTTWTWGFVGARLWHVGGYGMLEAMACCAKGIATSVREQMRTTFVIVHAREKDEASLLGCVCRGIRVTCLVGFMRSRPYVRPVLLLWSLGLHSWA